MNIQNEVELRDLVEQEAVAASRAAGLLNDSAVARRADRGRRA
jgi:hypothetical protein